MSEENKEKVYVFTPKEDVSALLVAKLLQGMLAQGRIAYPQKTFDLFPEEERKHFSPVNKPEQPRIIT